MIPNQGEDAAAERNTTAVERNGRTVNVKGKPTSVRKQVGDGEMAKERKGQSTSIIGWDKYILASIKKEKKKRNCCKKIKIITADDVQLTAGTANSGITVENREIDKCEK